MKLLFNLLFACVTFTLFIYLLLPAPPFPQKPTDSIQSLEAGDVETPLRRAYLTNLTRQEVLDFYTGQMQKVANIPLPTYRLNYPPEESQTLIRDQTRSTFLEEIVHPFRESVFVNGFEPKLDKDQIVYRGTTYRQQIKIKYVPSSIFVRVPLILGAMALLYFLFLELGKTGKSLIKEWLLTKYN